MLVLLWSLQFVNQNRFKVDLLYVIMKLSISKYLQFKFWFHKISVILWINNFPLRFSSPVFESKLNKSPWLCCPCAYVRACVWQRNNTPISTWKSPTMTSQSTAIRCFLPLVDFPMPLLPCLLSGWPWLPPFFAFIPRSVHYRERAAVLASF